MKKSTRNIFAYAKHPPSNMDDSKTFQNSQNSTTGNQTIYRAIIDQMDSEHSNYLNKLVVKNNREQQKNQQKAKSAKASLNHERTKSYADIMVGTPKNSKPTNDIGFSYRGHQKTSQVKNLFFSSQNTPTNQKQAENQGIKHFFKEKKEQKQSNPFISHLDSYLQLLSSKNNQYEKRNEFSIKNSQRKTVLKSRDPSPNVRILQKLQKAQKRVKQLKLHNHILQSQNQKLKKNQKKLKAKTKQKMQQVVDYARQLTFQLENERYERRKMQQFINDLQRKFTRMKPQRKNTNYRSNKIEQFLMLSESTDQDQIDPNIFEVTQFRPKSINSRKTGKNNKQSRLTGLTRQQIGSYAERQLQLSDEDSQSQQV